MTLFWVRSVSVAVMFVSVWLIFCWMTLFWVRSVSVVSLLVSMVCVLIWFGCVLFVHMLFGVAWWLSSLVDILLDDVVLGEIS